MGFEHRTVVLDMLALAPLPHGRASLGALFGDLFRQCLVVGYGVAGDVARLAASYPAIAELGAVEVMSTFLLIEETRVWMDERMAKLIAT